MRSGCEKTRLEQGTSAGIGLSHSSAQAATAPVPQRRRRWSFCCCTLSCDERPDEQPAVPVEVVCSQLFPPKPKGAPTPTVKANPPALPPKAVPKGPPPKAKAKAKTKAPPPPKAAKRKGGSCPPAAAWKGPKPSSEWKTDRIVNWNPIRQPGLLEGSIWQQVTQTIEHGKHNPLHEETLNRAFMRLVDEPKARSPRRFCPRPEVLRILPPKEALQADVVYSQLIRQGLASMKGLNDIVGMKPLPTTTPPPAKAASSAASSFSISSSSSSSSSTSSSSTSSTSSPSHSVFGERSEFENLDADETESETDQSGPPLNEDSLNTLLNLLRLACSVESKLLECKLPLAPSECLLQQLLIQVGSVALLQSRVQVTLSITCFPREAERLERILRSGIQAAKSAVHSTALPILLEGVLLLGNYVNSASRTLGSAHGVTLESVAKLAETRCRVSEAQDSTGNQNSQRTQRPKDALCLLVSQLQKTQESAWLPALRADLESCQAACDLDFAAALAGVKDLAAQVSNVDKCLLSCASRHDNTSEPPALRPARLKRFMAHASPQLAILRILEEELQTATATMRKHFAEPASRSLSDMLRSLAAILNALPKPSAPEESSRPQPYKALGKSPSKASPSRGRASTTGSTSPQPVVAMVKSVPSPARQSAYPKCPLPHDALSLKKFTISSMLKSELDGEATVSTAASTQPSLVPSAAQSPRCDVSDAGRSDSSKHLLNNDAAQAAVVAALAEFPGLSVSDAVEPPAE